MASQRLTPEDLLDVIDDVAQRTVERWIECPPGDTEAKVYRLALDTLAEYVSRGGLLDHDADLLAQVAYDVREHFRWSE